MKRKNMTICLTAFIVMLNCTLGIAAKKIDMSKLTEYQREQLEEIDRYIADLRRGIENNYRDRAAELKSRAEIKIRSLEVADKGVFSSLVEQAEIAKNILELNNSENFTRGFWRKAVSDEWKLDEFENYFHFEPTYRTIRPAKLFTTFQTLVAASKNNIYKKYEAGFATLQKNKTYALNVLLPELEEKLKQNLTKSQDKIAGGVISGIVCSEDKNSAVVDGKIIQQGDTLGQIKVVKVHHEHIEFEKNGKNWTQKIGEPGGSYWNK